jgi:hypothetical protein
MSSLVPIHKNIQIREPATIIPGSIPEQYDFLKAPIPWRKYRINFRHPAYAPDDNLLFTLHAWDHAEGGIHHGLAHNACSIIVDNRIDGYLSTTCDSEHGERIEATWDDLLLTTVTDYYFYVPYPSGRYLHFKRSLAMISLMCHGINKEHWLISCPFSLQTLQCNLAVVLDHRVSFPTP